MHIDITLQWYFKTKMKINVASLQHLMKGSHLVEDNTRSNTCYFDNIDYKIKYAMYKCKTMNLQFP